MKIIYIQNMGMPYRVVLDDEMMGTLAEAQRDIKQLAERFSGADVGISFPIIGGIIFVDVFSDHMTLVGHNFDFVESCIDDNDLLSLPDFYVSDMFCYFAEDRYEHMMKAVIPKEIGMVSEAIARFIRNNRS